MCFHHYLFPVDSCHLTSEKERKWPREKKKKQCSKTVYMWCNSEKRTIKCTVNNVPLMNNTSAAIANAGFILLCTITFCKTKQDN